MRTDSHVLIQGFLKNVMRFCSTSFVLFNEYMTWVFMICLIPVQSGVKRACCWQIPQDFLIDREDKDEILVIEGFVFKSTSSRESLQKLCSQDGSGCHFSRATGDWWRPRPFLSDTVSKVKRLTGVTTAGRWETTSSAHDKTETKHFEPLWVLCSSF